MLRGGSCDSHRLLHTSTWGKEVFFYPEVGKLCCSGPQGRASEDLGVLIGPFHLSGHASRHRAPPLVGRNPPRAARARARVVHRVEPASPVAVRRPSVRWPRSRLGGGAGEAWQPPWGSEEQPPVCGTGAAGGGPRPALQRVRT